MNKTKASNLFLISACVFAISVFVGYLGYVIISGAPILRREANLNQPAANNTFAEVITPVDAAAEREYPVVAAGFSDEYYIVRENDGRIGVFAHRNGEVHFLYNIDRLVRFLPEADQELLRQGVVLYTREELTKFEEDFSS